MNIESSADSVGRNPARESLRQSAGWLFAERALLVIWVAAALMTMYPQLRRAVGLDAGFFTSYAADLTNPPWVYIVLRRGAGIPVGRWFGRSPASAAFSIFVFGVMTELSQIHWPHGFFAGTFDPMDIAAYGVGLLICSLIDRHQLRTPSAPRAGVE